MPYFVPLGIPGFNNKTEKDYFQFTYEIEDNDAIELIIQICDGAKVLCEETIIEATKLSQGEHTWKWDGFDSSGILNTSAVINAKNLNFYAVGKDKEGNQDRTTVDFEAEYEEVDWVDVKIDKNTKRINVTLRVDLQDGGAEVIEDWDDIPKKDLITEKLPIEKRIKNFKDLQKLALDGINYHWRRNSNHFTAKNVTINGDSSYEVYLNAVNTVTQSENSSATNYPTKGEIDIMPYYKNWTPYNQRNKMVTANKDVLSLIWLTKI